MNVSPVKLPEVVEELPELAIMTSLRDRPQSVKDMSLGIPSHMFICVYQGLQRYRSACGFFTIRGRFATGTGTMELLSRRESLGCRIIF